MSEPALRKPSGTLPTLAAHTLRLQTKSVLIWGVILGLYCAMLVASFLSLEDQIPEFEALLESYPQAFLEAFGITTLSTPEAFMGGQFLNWAAPLALCFFTILAAAGAIAGSEERGTIDVVLGNPIPRWQYVVGNFAATAVSLLGILAITGLIMWGTARAVDVDLALSSTVDAMLNLAPICLAFGALAMLCSAVFHRRVLAVAIPGVVLFAMYLMDVIAGISEDLEGIKYASAFHYYGTAVEDGINWAHFAGLLGVAILLLALAVLAFRRRDIYT